MRVDMGGRPQRKREDKSHPNLTAANPRGSNVDRRICRNTALPKWAIARGGEQQTLLDCCMYKTHVASAPRHCRRADWIPAPCKTKQSALLFDHRRRICTVERQVAQVDQLWAGRDASPLEERRAESPLRAVGHCLWKLWNTF
jgi:hypothetical protein